MLKPVEIGAAPDGTADFTGNKGMLSPVQEPGSGLPVSAVNLTKVSGLVSGSYVTLTDKGSNPDYRRGLDEQHPEGISSQTVISVFEVVANSTESSIMTFVISVNSGWEPKNIRFIHGSKGTDGTITWESAYLTSGNPVPTSDGKYQYTVTTSNFSPFAIVYAVPTPAPKSSSRDYGSSVWLTATPTPTPIAEPTPEPTLTQPVASPVKPAQTSASPVPAAGIIAGLGAAGVFFGVRRK